MQKKWYNQRKKPISNNSLNLDDTQLEVLKSTKNLPIELIRIFQNHIDIPMTTRTTPIKTIIDNRDLKWDMGELLHKKDIRMEHTKYFDLKWDYSKLTLMEPDKCNIAKYPNLKWCSESIAYIDVKFFCKEHLILLLKKYDNIKWNWKKITNMFNIEEILCYPYFNWDNEIFYQKILNNKENKNILELVISSFDKVEIYESLLTSICHWDLIVKYPNKPWDFFSKSSHYCTCYDNGCSGRIRIYHIKKLKDKKLNWYNITRSFSYNTIISNKDIPSVLFKTLYIIHKPS